MLLNSEIIRVKKGYCKQRYPFEFHQPRLAANKNVVFLLNFKTLFLYIIDVFHTNIIFCVVSEQCKKHIKNKKSIRVSN